MKVKIKICGITNIDDALAAVDFGADALGFVFFKGSPRCISISDSGDIIRKVAPFVTTVGVFVDEKPEHIEETVDSTGIDIIQLHGDEPPDACRFARRIIKAVRMKSLESLDPLIHYKDKVSAFVLDTFTPDVFGGTGLVFNWDIAAYARQFGRIILAGGLSPENVAEAIKRVGPYGVDVSSGVESAKGIKDHKKMKMFIERVKAS